MSDAPERTIHSDGRAVVTDARLVVGGTTYAVRNIASVRVEPRPGGRGVWFVVLLVGLAVAVVAGAVGMGAFGLADKLPPRVRQFPWLPVAAGGALIAVLGLIGLIRARPRHALVVRDSSGETLALVERDGAYVARLAEAVGRAIVAAGGGR